MTILDLVVRGIILLVLAAFTIWGILFIVGETVEHFTL